MHGTIELLAPAGSLEGFYAVINAGCDAVYVGAERFSARAYADNPDPADLLKAIDDAHLRNVKVYLTVNTLFKEDELAQLIEFITPYYEAGIDAVLVQDFGVLRCLHRYFPDLPLHASTQMTITGPSSASLLKKYGVTRVVPARELSLAELKKIHDDTGLEVEAFVHGALCYSYSGQCLMSSLIGGRSGNRGRCAQPCRLMYEASGQSGSLLSLKDLCTIDVLQDLIENGVVSLKIEGRMKQSAYAAGVVSIYRKMLDQIFYPGRDLYMSKREAENDLCRLFSREGFTHRYLTEHNGKDMMAFHQHGGAVKSDEALLAQMKNAYVHEPDKIKISGTVDLAVGRHISISAACGLISVIYLSDYVPEEASSAVMSEERIREQLTKTGDTPFAFEDLRIKIEGRPFIPVKWLNELRRNILKVLRDELLSAYHRDASKLSDAFSEESENEKRTCETTPTVTVSVETEKQYETALSTDYVSRICYPLTLLLSSEDPAGKAEMIASAIHAAGKEACVSMPYVMRHEKTLFSYDTLTGSQLIRAGFDRIRVRSFENMAALINEGLSDVCQTDECLYCWNHEAAAFYRENGITSMTAPAELNSRELATLDTEHMEMIIYGRTPMMTTASCIRKNTEGCQMSPSGHLCSLTDRKGQKMPVRTVCGFCYNTIYNSVPLSLSDEAYMLKRIPFASYRISFTTEDPIECRRLLDEFHRALINDEKVRPTYSRTKGHFRRGVE